MSIHQNAALASNERDSSVQPDTVAVSLDVVWAGSTAKHDARMSEISMAGCYIDSKTQGMTLGDTIEFKVHLPDGPWVSLQGELILEDYPSGFELRFLKLTEGDQRLLAQVVVAHGGNTGSSTSDVPDLLNRKDSSQFRERPTLCDSAVVSEGAKSGRPRPKAVIKGRVLIADDDPLTLRMVSAIVTSERYEAVAVADGREALRVLQQDGLFCAAIFDMSMPYVQGLDLILYMKAEERLRSIPVGMITAEQDPKVWDDSVAAGASVFLPKPFTPPQVAMMLRMLALQSSKSVE